MVEKQHKNLLADIRGYISVMGKTTELNFQPSDFFIESSYIDSTGRSFPCYLLTKKSCDMVANKMTGEYSPVLIWAIRCIEVSGEPWMVGKDVAAALGYTDTFGALKKHVDDEDKQNCQNGSFESPRGMIVINESGLYSLVLSSKLPGAKKFRSNFGSVGGRLKIEPSDFS